MPVGFLTDQQRQLYGRFHGKVNSEDFSRYLGIGEPWNVIQSYALCRVLHYVPPHLRAHYPKSA